MVARWKGQPGTRRSPSDGVTFDGKNFIVMELLEVAFWENGSNPMNLQNGVIVMKLIIWKLFTKRTGLWSF